MAKTELTRKIETELWLYTRKTGVFSCLEVTLGFRGRERVDYMTVDTKGSVRCYEVKVSKSDFHSKSKTSFVGQYNYFVMPKALYEQVKTEIPDGVGVIGYYADSIPFKVEKKPKRRELAMPLETIKDSMIRSLYRELDKRCLAENERLIGFYRQEIEAVEKENRELQKNLLEIRNEQANLRHFLRRKYEIDIDLIEELMKREGG